MSKIGRRFSLWVPEDEEWIFDTLKKLVKVAKANGSQSSVGHELRRALKRDLKKYKHESVNKS